MTVQAVIEYDLRDFASGPGRLGYDAAEAVRQLNAQMEQIDPGTMVRLKVGKYKPLRGHIPIRRSDIVLQIVSGDAEAFKAWHEVFEPEAILDY